MVLWVRSEGVREGFSEGDGSVLGGALRDKGPFPPLAFACDLPRPRNLAPTPIVLEGGRADEVDGDGGG